MSRPQINYQKHEKISKEDEEEESREGGGVGVGLGFSSYDSNSDFFSFVFGKSHWQDENSYGDSSSGQKESRDAPYDLGSLHAGREAAKHERPSEAPEDRSNAGSVVCLAPDDSPARAKMAQVKKVGSH